MEEKEEWGGSLRLLQWSVSGGQRRRYRQRPEPSLAVSRKIRDKKVKHCLAQRRDGSLSEPLSVCVFDAVYIFIIDFIMCTTSRASGMRR